MTAQALLQALPFIMSAIGGLTGKDAQQGSTYNKGQLSGLDDILQSIKGMKGGAQDITQNQNYQQGSDYFNSLFNDQDFFNKFEVPAFRQLNEEILPGIANRFAGMGSGGSLGSTAFRNQANRAGTDLATNLAAQRGNMQAGAIPQMLSYAQQPFSNLMSLYQQALQPTQNQYIPASMGFGGNIGAAGIGALSQGYGQQLGQGMAGGGMSQPTGQPGFGAGWDSMFRQQGVY